MWIFIYKCCWRYCSINLESNEEKFVWDLKVPRWQVTKLMNCPQIIVNNLRSYAIEKCYNSHILKEYDILSFQEEEESLYYNSSSSAAYFNNNQNEDNVTVATYSVMIYYTPQVTRKIVITKKSLLSFI